MHPPLFVRELSGAERAQLEAGLRAASAFTVRRAQIVLLSAAERPPRSIAQGWCCAVHKERNLLAHAPKHLQEEIKADFHDMMHAKTAAEVRAKRKAFLVTWKLRCRAVADSLDEAGERLFTFLRYSPEQWRSLRTTNAIERLHGAWARPSPTAA